MGPVTVPCVRGLGGRLLRQGGDSAPLLSGGIIGWVAERCSQVAREQRAVAPLLSRGMAVRPRQPGGQRWAPSVWGLPACPRACCWAAVDASRDSSCVGAALVDWWQSGSTRRDWRGVARKPTPACLDTRRGTAFTQRLGLGARGTGSGRLRRWALWPARNESADPCPGPAISAPTSQTAPCFCTARHVPRLRFTVKYDGARAVVSVRKCTAARCMRWCCCLPSRSYATSQAAMTLLNRGSTCQHAHGLVQRCCSHMIRAL